jgi:hypothetical protein
MVKVPDLLRRISLGISAVLLIIAGPPAVAGGGSGLTQEISSTKGQPIGSESYILGQGDSLKIELLDIPELSGFFSIGPDGTVYLPRLRALYVEGLTVEEFATFSRNSLKSTSRIHRFL